MGQRLRFTDNKGTPLGYVDRKGDTLKGSNDKMQTLVDTFTTNSPVKYNKADAFFDYYSRSKQSSFLNSTFVDSKTDKTEYPA